MLNNIGVTAGGYVAAFVLFGLWLNARDAIIEEREGCNADKLSTALEAEKIAREAEQAAYEQRIADLAQEAERERAAARIAEEAAEEARNRPEKVRTVIREVASANACIDTVMPVELVDSLFND